MNINTVQKHYDKLTVKERFALLVAAGMRGDDQERDALLRSAPRKVFSFPNTYGLSKAFEFLSMWHIMTMAELESLYWLWLAIGDDEIKLPDDHTWMDVMDIIQRRALSRDSAWRAVCEEYRIDPDEMLKDYPCAVSIVFLVDVMKEYNEYNPLEIDPTEYINDLRAVIEHKRKEWE